MVCDPVSITGRAVAVVVAVGLFLTAESPADGVVWAPQRTRFSGSIEGVSCVSARACIAVGQTGTGTGAPAMGWDGRRWKVASVPAPVGTEPYSLEAVSCTSDAACIAVGNYRNGVILQEPWAVRWNGVSWSLLPAPGLSSELVPGGV